MFINPTTKGHHVLDADSVIPKAIVPSIVNFELEDEFEPEAVEPDPFLQSFEEEDLYFDDFIDFYCGQHVHDNVPS